MALFRKKPVEVYAEQFLPTAEPLPFKTHGVCIYEDGSWYINTLEGDMRINEGDWVIQGVKGEFYPCKPDIFTLTYEAV